LVLLLYVRVAHTHEPNPGGADWLANYERTSKQVRYWSDNFPNAILRRDAPGCMYQCMRGDSFMF